EIPITHHEDLRRSGLIDTGLVNDPRVPLRTSSIGAWASAAALQILGELRAMYTEYRTVTQRNPQDVADTLLLPEAAYTHVEQTPVGDNADKTILKYLVDNIPELRAIEFCPFLEGIGAGGTDRAMLYNRSADAVRAVLPLQMRFLSPETTPLKTMFRMVERNAGVEFVRAYAAQYTDGV
ncbi:MAG: major capsid family protein, partial [Myxococcota bacterium]